MCMTHSFYHASWLQVFQLFQFLFFQVKMVYHREGHVIFQYIYHQLQEIIFHHYLHCFFCFFGNLYDSLFLL